MLQALMSTSARGAFAYAVVTSSGFVQIIGDMSGGVESCTRENDRRQQS
jgi:hypothetical protein